MVICLKLNKSGKLQRSKVCTKISTKQGNAIRCNEIPTKGQSAMLCNTIHTTPHQSIGSLSNENVAQKYIFISFVLLRDYFNSLNFYKNGELSRNQIGRNGFQVKKENEKFTVVRSRSPQHLKCGHLMLFCRGWQRNVPKCKTYVQSDCFCSLNLLFCGVVVAVAVVVA